MRTWEYWQRHPHGNQSIGIEDYEAVGTISDALSRHADEAFSKLQDQRSREIAEKLFKALSECELHNCEKGCSARLDTVCGCCKSPNCGVSQVIRPASTGAQHRYR